MTRPPHTGKFATREELVENIVTMLRRGQSYRVVARRCGVSLATAHNIYQAECIREMHEHRTKEQTHETTGQENPA